MRIDFSTESLRYAFGWHQAPWISVFTRALSDIDSNFADVLEFGASRRSAPSLLFVGGGSRCDITCYSDRELQPLAAFCEKYCAGSKLAVPDVRTADILASSDERKYDLIILKGVLGGLHRYAERAVEKAVANCIAQLKERGHLIVMDKGWCTLMHHLLLRRFGGAGKNNWHYFTENDLSLIEAGHIRKIYWSGFFSVGVMPFKWMETVLNGLDRIFCNRFLRHRGVVFCAVYQKADRRGVERGMRAQTTAKDKSAISPLAFSSAARNRPRQAVS